MPIFERGETKLYYEEQGRGISAPTHRTRRDALLRALLAANSLESH